MSKKKNHKINKNVSIKEIISTFIFLIMIIIFTFFAEATGDNSRNNETNENIFGQIKYNNLADIPDYSDEICVMINNNKPYFTEEDYTIEDFENYSELDYLGRCGVAFANICKETMPPKGDERGDISSIRPTGWKQAKINGEYLYNRCHLIAYSLSDEDANKQNLITGTRYFNVQGMLPIENLVLEYMKKNKDNHVLYRVTPVFKGENLLATGVEMEAYSVEDNGELSFNVFVYNIQPGAKLDYATGKLLSN